MNAWQVHEASMCSGCGQDMSRSMNPDMDSWYEVKEIRCYACEALEARRETHKPDMSLHQFVIDTRPPDDKPPPWQPNFEIADDEDAGVAAET